MTNRERSTLLLVGDDGATRAFLADNLTADGYEVVVADTAEESLRLLGSLFPDVVLVDAGLPGAAGLDLVSHVREADGIASRVDPAVPVVVLGARDGELDRVRAFERGADDVLGRPFSYRELRCRLDALLRRANRGRGGGRLRVGELEIDTAARVVHLAGTPLDLSAKEFALLRVLAGKDTGPRSDIVCLNAAPLLYITGKAATLREGLEMARQAVAGGKALAKLRDWVTWQNQRPEDGLPTLEKMLGQI